MFYGPTMYWDSRINPETSLPYDCPSISRSSVGWTRTDAPVVDTIKASVAGYVCRRELSELPNDQITVGSDIAGAPDWYKRHIGGTDEEFRQILSRNRASASHVAFVFWKMRLRAWGRHAGGAVAQALVEARRR